MKKTLFTLLGILTAVVCGPVFSQTAQELYQKGLHLEEVKGELEKAIEVYKSVIEKHKANKSIAAKTLLHLGNCYEKLGRKEAKKAYERIVREFADQRDVVAKARVRLAALAKAENGSPMPAMTTRQVWAGPGVDVEGTVSSDGRFLSFVDWSTGDIAIRDLQTGENRRLTHKGDWSSPGFADFSTISHDGRDVAYIWYNGKQYDLRVVSTDGSEPRVIYQNDEVPYFWPHAWTPDKKFIVANFYRKDKTNQIALISTSDRSVRILKNFDWRPPGHLSVSPNGKWIAYSSRPKEDDKQHDIFLVSVDGTQETHLVEHSANDDTPVWTPDGKAILFRSDRGVSHGLWLVRIANGGMEGNPELIKANVGDIFPLGFNDKGAFFYGIIGGGNDVFSLDLDSKQAELTSTPKLISQKYVGFSSVPAWSPDGNSLAYVIDKKPGFGFPGRAIVIKSVKTGKEAELPHEGFQIIGFNLKWSPDGNSLLVSGRTDSTSKPSRSGLFRVDAQTGNAKFLDVRLVQSNVGHGGFGWSPDGKFLFLVRYALPEEKLNIARIDVGTGDEQDIFKFGEGDDLRFTSLSPNAKQFACWNIVKDTKSLLLVPTDGGAPREILKEKRDVANLGTPAGIAWTPDGKQLIYGKRVGRNKSELWKIVIEDGSSQRIGIIDLPVHDIEVHPNGTRLALSTNEYKAEVWVMENFLPKEERAQQ